MKMEKIEEALKVGHTVSYGEMERPTTICEFARGVEMVLRKMQDGAGFPKGWIIGMVAGWVKQWTDAKQCP